MSHWWWIGIAAGGATLALSAVLWRKIHARLLRSEYQRYRSEFHLQRERLEAKFFELAAATGKPRGLRWTDCTFDDEVTYARHRQTGELCAFVATTISFEAIEGGGMEEVEAVSNLRAATAVFRLDRGRWQTEGRAIFNLNPAETIAYYQDNLVLLDHEPARA